MIESSRNALIVFVLSVLAVIGLLGFTTSRMLTLEREELKARAEASRQEAIRLALWRLDSAIAPIIAQEAARPYFHYLPYYAEQRAFTRVWEPVRPGEVLVPSPLIEGTPRFILLHFQLSSSGLITSPQVPRGNDRDLAESEPGGTERVARYEQVLEQFQAFYPPDLYKPIDQRTTRMGLLLTSPAQDRVPDASTPPAIASTPAIDLLDAAQLSRVDTQDQIEYGFRKGAAERAASASDSTVPPRPLEGNGTQTSRTDVTPPAEETLATGTRSSPSQQTRTAPAAADSRIAPADAQSEAAEASTRGISNSSEAVQKSLDDAQRINAGPDPTSGPRLGREHAPRDQASDVTTSASSTTSRPDIMQSPFVPRWRVTSRGDAPLLVFWRTVRTESSINAQGFWVDWALLREHLRSLVDDLLPEASITPLVDVLPPDEEFPSNLLASIPARLETPAAIPPPLKLITPAHLTLALTWVAALGAIAAVGLSLRASIALGERRGRFVSAVTHELRTPLTTFCLYSQMLADGMVTDEHARREYIETLRDESTRLQRIVENVLDFARLGRNQTSTVVRDAINLRTAIEHLMPTLTHRAEQSNATLVLTIEPDANDAVARVSPDIIERILLNLVDNACKYGTSREHPAIRITLRKDGPYARILVQDNGPGISPKDRRGIFKPFIRGRAQDASPTQGLGLGLSLARALAERTGGTLELLSGENTGATFQISFPLATNHTNG